MITRAQMPRQLRDKGGIASVTPRENYGLGSKIKDRFRKLIPNELADIAVKAAPFVAPFNPGVAGLMRGIGRFDQRGSISDALKQGAATFGFGAATRALGGADPFGGGLKGGFTSPLDAEKTTKFKNLFEGGKDIPTVDKEKTGPLKNVAEKVFKNVPFSDQISTKVKEKLLVGTITSGATALYSYFTGEFEPQEVGESLEEYMARRKENVKSQMRQVMDSYYTPLRNPEYAAMSDEEKNNFIDGVVGSGMATGGRVGYQNGGITMSNTLAENIRRNRAAQAAFNQMIRPAQIKASKITPSKITPIQPTPSKITPIETRPIEIKELNLNRNPALNFFKPQQPQFLTPTKTQIQTGPQPGELDPLGLPMSMTMLPGDGLQSLAEMEAITKRIEAAQAAMKPTYEERLMGESWETLSDNDQYIIAQEYPGETPPRRNPDFVPGLAKGGRVRFSEGANLKIKLKEIGYEDTLLDKLSLKELRELFDSEKGTFTDQGTYREPAKKGGMPTGIMRANKAGVMERDYRDRGGFVPVGIKEKADDVPAMLSKNEFVFTADAVRGAGNGSIEKGAQKMYDTMKNLEKRVT